MSIRIPKKIEPELSDDDRKAVKKAARANFRPGSEHNLPVSGRTYVADDTGAWRRQKQEGR